MIKNNLTFVNIVLLTQQTFRQYRCRGQWAPVVT
jgi:hypothetical protein